MRETDDDDAFTRSRSLTDDSTTGSPRSPQPDGSRLPATEAFHRHLDGCAQCRADPFDLCLTGAVLLRAAADEQDRP